MYPLNEIATIINTNKIHTLIKDTELNKNQKEKYAKKIHRKLHYITEIMETQIKDNWQGWLYNANRRRTNIINEAQNIISEEFNKPEKNNSIIKTKIEKIIKRLKHLTTEIEYIQSEKYITKKIVHK